MDVNRRLGVALVFLAGAIVTSSATIDDGLHPTVGITYSGGGLTGILCSMCAQHKLEETILRNVNATSYYVSTASGGTIGYLVGQNDKQKKIEYPDPLTSNTTYKTLSSNKVASGKIWWGNVVNYLPSLAGNLHVGDDTKGWWQDVMKTLFTVGYDIKPADLTGGPSPYLANFAVVEAASCAIKRNKSNGVMLEAAKYLHQAVYEAPSGDITIQNDVTLSSKSASGLGIIDAVTFSSAFYAAGIIESAVEYAAEVAAEAINKGVLIVGTASRGNSTKEKTVYLMDGGFVDTTGIVALLQRKVGKIFAQYNNNDDLVTMENASFAFLFGVDGPTDTMNSLAGPVLTQVFSSDLYPAVFANLTDPKSLFVRLTNVAVKQNTYLGVEPYVLDELIILSNQFSDEFVSTFADPDVAKHLDPLWPNKLPAGMSTFDANMLCAFNRWKVERYSKEIAGLFE